MAKAGLVLFMMLVGCVSSGEPGPVAVDAGEVDAAPQDAASDAPDADPCWMRIVVQCVPEELIQLCVPRVGCAAYVCDGMSYAYCGPGM